MTNPNLHKHLLTYLNKPFLQDNNYLCKAMRHLLMAPGKLFRPRLLLAAHQTFAPLNDLAYQAALALECIHTFSLVHDDLPDMDDAAQRRHQPSVHKSYGNAHAILAGDALLNLGFDVLAHAQGSAEQRLSLIQILTKATGHEGMTYGQSLDIQSPNTPDTLLACYELKTGALMAAACTMGAISAGVTDPTQTQSLQAIGNHIGLYFQIQDDLFDYNRANSGKTQQPNASNLTQHFGAHQCHSLIEHHQNQALTLIKKLPNSKPLYELLNQYLVRAC